MTNVEGVDGRHLQPGGLMTRIKIMQTTHQWQAVQIGPSLGGTGAMRIELVSSVCASEA